MGRKTILLVEDDAVIRDIIKSAFEKEYDVLEASGCSQALALLGNSFDLALTDYMMPDGDGFDVIKAIREVRPAVPIIMMTAYSSEDLVVKALRAGATDYVKKPLALSYLRSKISDILGGEKEEELAELSANRQEFILNAIAAFIEDHYSDDLTRDMLAEKACMNKSKFSRAFNDKFGQSIKSYLNKIRVKKAAELLTGNKDLSITDIAHSVGYKNIVHFDRIFKETFGLSPKEYRANPSAASRQSSPLWDID